MLKKALAISFILSLTACGSDNTLNQQMLQQQQVEASASKNQEKNGIFSYVNEGSATFVFTEGMNGQKLSTTPTIDVSLKKLGITAQKFNTVTLVMPSGEMRGYTRITNDGGLYLEDYGTNNYYKVGTWTKKDKFKGKGYINLNSKIDESLYFQKFDIKLDSVVKDIKSDLPLNPMSHKYLYFHTSTDIKPVTKTKADFDLTKFIATK